MDFLVRVLNERGDDLARNLSDDLGFSAGEAERFVAEAGPALIDSYLWQAERFSGDDFADPAAVRDLLAGISGRSLARRVGLSDERTWLALRELVPAVIDASRGLPRRGVPRRGGPTSGTRPHPRDKRPDHVQRFEVGFGLHFVRRLDSGSKAPPASEAVASHPIFGWLLNGRAEQSPSRRDEI